MKINVLLKVLSILALSFFIISCEDDDPISSQEEHFEAIGMVFYTSGIEIARILRGETSDTLTTTEGGMSDHINIKYIDEDENIIDPPGDDGDKTLRWEIEDTGIADIWQHEGEEDSFEFHLEGLEKGETSIEFFIYHNDHSDYRSGSIPIKIDAASEETHGKPIGLFLIAEDSGDTLVTVNDSIVNNSLNVDVNTTSNHIIVKLFDASGVEFQPLTPPHSLVVNVGDSSLLSITGQDDDEPWAFKIKGLITGTTTITVIIMHEVAIGKEYVPINVNVN